MPDDEPLESMQRVEQLINEMVELDKRRGEVFIQLVGLFPEVALEASTKVGNDLIMAVSETGFMGHVVLGTIAEKLRYRT